MNVSFKSVPAMSNSNVQSGNNVKKVGKVLVGTALVAGGLAVAAKKGKFDYSGHNKFASAVLKAAKNVGTKIADAAIGLKDKIIVKSKNTFAKAPVVGTDRSAEAVKTLEKSVAAEKLAKAQDALKTATTDNAKVGIQNQIEKLTAIING